MTAPAATDAADSMRVWGNRSWDTKGSQLGKLAPVAAFKGATAVLCKVPHATSTPSADKTPKPRRVRRKEVEGMVDLLGRGQCKSSKLNRP
jgi:hypothetical protein